MKTLFKNVNLLDGKKDMPIQEDIDILINDGRIIKIDKNIPVDSQTKVIDLTNKYAIPGLINIHSHLIGNGKPQKITEKTPKIIQQQLNNVFGYKIMQKMCEKSAKIELFSGVTTVRTVGGLADIDAKIKDRINNNKLVGSRLVVSNTAISVPHGHMAGTLAYIAHDENEAMAILNKVISSKPDWIKLMVTGGSLDIKEVGEEGKVLMPLEMVKLLTEKSHQLGYKVSAHIQSLEGIKVCLKANVDSIEHGANLDIEAITGLKNGSALISTTAVTSLMANLPITLTKISPICQKSCQQYLGNVIQGFKEAVNYDIPIGLGLDNGSPYITHYAMWRELEAFHRYIGVSRNYCLYLATLSNAKILGMQKDIGSIEEGKIADLVVVNNNPLEHFKNLEKPHMVIKQGKIYKNPKFHRNKKLDRVFDLLEKYDQPYVVSGE